MIDVDGHVYGVVWDRDEHSLIVRHCLQRPSDGHWAVGFVERIPFEGDEEKTLNELPTPWEQINFTTEDAASWRWWPTHQEAIDASKVTFAPYENWSANAQD